MDTDDDGAGCYSMGYCWESLDIVELAWPSRKGLLGKICMHVAVMTTPQSPGPNYDPNSVS